MPRGPRLDSPGTLHHVMVRGIDRGNIIEDDEDRQDFISRLGHNALETGTSIFAYALMTNHAHLLIKSGTYGLSGFMRKLLTGYATVFNRRHKRYGHLFQNRYKSIVCEEDAYFRKLVCYIHLNPLRAGIVKSLDELDCYRWGSHAVIMRTIGCTWLNRDYVLHYFGDEEESAVNFYRRCVEEEHNLGQQPLLVGGGLIRSTGGWSEVKSLKSRGEKRYFDERILGGSDFVKSMLEQADESVKGRIPADGNLQAAIDDLSSKCVQAGILVSALQSGSRRRECSELRKRLAEMLVKDYGLSYAETARQLGISTSAVNQIFFRLKQQ